MVTSVCLCFLILTYTVFEELASLPFGVCLHFHIFLDSAKWLRNTSCVVNAEPITEKLKNIPRKI